MKLVGTPDFKAKRRQGKLSGRSEREIGLRRRKLSEFGAADDPPSA